MKDLTSLSVIVTGGGSGIGEATARHLARGGAMVTICGRRADRIEAVAKEIGPNCAWVVADVTKDAEVRPAPHPMRMREPIFVSCPASREGLGEIPNKTGHAPAHR